MAHESPRNQAKLHAAGRPIRKFPVPEGPDGKHLRVSEYYGMNTLDVRNSSRIPTKVREEVQKVLKTKSNLTEESASEIARAVTEWAQEKGVTHFCHWFQPLTGGTAEKHDAFLSIKDGEPIEKLTGSQLMQGEPDASSFPHGGSRSTFEARGYTSWDLSSPLFIIEGTNGKTLCIPTAFVSYHGQALDVKTPLLRSARAIDTAATKFLNAIGDKDVTSVKTTCGAEQEYFLVDDKLYTLRPDLVMGERTLIGNLPARNQQLEDHYFGTVPEKALAVMQELEVELYKLGIPAKTRHNEVAPSQFEIAPIFEESNIAADHNQVLMSVVKKVAKRHGMRAILHEKPFAEINGSGKHLNWSMQDSTGRNLLEPGDSPHANTRFLAINSIVIEAVHRHANSLRAAIAGHGNDHRLGANEAPPSVISVFLGDTLDKIYSAIAKGEGIQGESVASLDLGADELVNLRKDNTDRNRTSPFAFTGNKFEFRAVGSSQTIGWPLTILNAAVAEVLNESSQYVETEIKSGKTVEQALLSLTKKWINSAAKVIFNGDGYTDEWIKEAASRGLPNLRNTPAALEVFNDLSACQFLIDTKVLTESELKTRYNVFLERYVKHREIEFKVLVDMVYQNVLPSWMQYKGELLSNISTAKAVGLNHSLENELVQKIDTFAQQVIANVKKMENGLSNLSDMTEPKAASILGNELLPLSEEIATDCNKIEALLPDHYWTLPKYFDMLFID